MQAMIPETAPAVRDSIARLKQTEQRLQKSRAGGDLKIRPTDK